MSCKAEELTGRVAFSVLQEDALYPVGGVQMVLVLPDADDLPVFVGQGLVDFTIPLLVTGKLRTPKVGVGLRHRAVIRATVPKAAVDVDGHFLAWEDEVGAGTDSRHRWAVDPEPQTTSVQLTAQGELGSGVSLPKLRHLVPDRG